ncbi:MAG: hypothetical protein ACTSYI_11995 [Promethearchaeota archaeon]
MAKHTKILMKPGEFLSLLLDKMKDVKIETNYARSYHHFIEFFANIEKIEEHHFFISTNFVYGWMPTILNYKSDRITECVSLLNEVKKGNMLSKDELSILKSTINNSAVGVSKLLHFIHPDNYAIWDSRICAFLYGSPYKTNDVCRFREYIDFMQDMAHSSDFEAFHLEYKQKFHDLSSGKMRALENTMFHLGKRQRKKKGKTVKYS